jgi:predicted permease
MFTLVDHVLLAPLPFSEPQQLVSLASLDSVHHHIETVSVADWQDWTRAQVPSLSGMSLSAVPWNLSLDSGDSAIRVTATRVSSNYFSVLRPRFIAGRGFTADEGANGAESVVISEQLWRSALDADTRLPLRLRTPDREFDVVGVLAAGQEMPADVEVWFPAALAPEGVGLHNNINWVAMGRLAPRATIEQATSQLAAVSASIRAADPDALYNWGVDVRPLRTELIGDAAGYLRLLMGVVCAVLLIVCANVAAAALGRASVRSREMAVRASLGASRGRLVQQLLIEHVLLALIGGALGVIVGWAGLHALIAQWGDEIPRVAELSIDGPVFLFAFVASLLAGVVAGLVPALRVSGTSLRGLLAAGGRTAARGGRNLAGSTLVATEIALALLLVTGAALLVESFRAVLARDLGFQTNVATAEIGLPAPTYGTDPARRLLYWRSLVDSYRAIPGVQSAGVTAWLPLGPTGQSFIEIPGRALDHEGAVYRPVSADFLRTIGVPLIVGRMLDANDGAGTQPVVLINRMLARRFWPSESPIGKQIRATTMAIGTHGEPAPWMTVVGVVGDVRTWGLEADARPEMYVPIAQAPSWSTVVMTAVVRADARASTLLPEMRKRARLLEPRVAPVMSTLDARFHSGLASRTMTMTLVSGFAGLALVLAAIGIYGVLSYAVTQRTRELAVRAALGAQRGQLLRLVMTAGLRVVAAGAIVGIAAAVALTRLLNGMLVGVAPTDPRTYLLSLLVLAAIALAAIVIPARRATRLDPMIALQSE